MTAMTPEGIQRDLETIAAAKSSDWQYWLVGPACPYFDASVTRWPLALAEAAKIAGLEAENRKLRELLLRCQRAIQFALQQSWSGSQEDAFCDLRDAVDAALAESAADQ